MSQIDKRERLKALGLAVRQIRNEKGLSQEDLAYSIDKDQPSINRLERGRINPSYLYLLEITFGLEVKLEDITQLADKIFDKN